MSPSPTLCHQESSEAPSARMQRAAFHQVHKDPPAPSPPRAVASLSVRVLSQPDRQGLPPAVSRAQEKEGTAASEMGSGHPVLHLSRSAGVSAGSNVQEDSDEDDDDDESEDDDDWGPGPGTTRRDNRVPSQPQQMPPSVSSAVARSKRKLQPPQHIPPPQVHHTPMQLRHPTPPPSPPPNLFPLPDTPKQSPPNTDDHEGPRVASFPPPTMQRQDSDLSSRSSSPEPPVKRRPGPLSLLVHKMESERAFHSEETTSAAEMSGETADSTPGSSSESPLQRLERKRQQENREMEEKRRLKEDKEREEQQEQERERRKAQKQEREKKCLEEEMEKERKRLQEEEKQRQKEEQEKERKCQEEEKERRHREEEKRREEKQFKEEQDKSQQTATKERVVVTEAQDSDSSSDSDSKSDSSSRSSQSSSSSRDARQLKVSDHVPG